MLASRNFCFSFFFFFSSSSFFPSLFSFFAFGPDLGPGRSADRRLRKPAARPAAVIVGFVVQPQDTLGAAFAQVDDARPGALEERLKNELRAPDAGASLSSDFEG